jgi:hypothetical protein
MCAVSYIADDWTSRHQPDIGRLLSGVTVPIQPGPTQAAFDALKAEVEELKLLLKAAKRYDEKTGQPNCEMAEKIAFLRKVAEFVGVDFSDVFSAGEM